MKKYFYKLQNIYTKHGSKKNILIFMVLSLFLMAIIGYGYGMIQSSKERVISGFEKAMLSNSKKDILKYCKLDSDEIKLDSNNVEAFMKYIKENPHIIKNKIDVLRYKTKEESKDEMIRLESKKAFIGYRYKVLISPIYISINTRLKNTEVFLNNKLYYKAEKDNQVEKLGPLVPGTYNIEGVINTYEGKVKESKKVTLLDKENTININPKVGKISVNSDSIDAKVFINGKDTEKTVKEFKNIGPVPMDGSLKLYIEEQYPWGKAKSEEVEIKDIGDIKLKVNAINDELRKNLSSLLNDFYYNAYRSMEEQDKSMMKNCTDKVKDEFYKIYNENKRFFKSKYIFSELKLDENAIEIKKEHLIYKAIVQVSVTYTKENNFYGFNLGSEEENYKFINELIFENNEMNWKVFKIKVV
ncbi:putative membrane protein YvbJ [Clostridium tetanomorphum]|uniref:Membrane-associated protein n=1 Tax=Clostridium tetanomorphum TaxID=1553 RepID=A0A923J0A6_CLOTT|nr:hypothetical protein [Clostridium tetanomorphum]KAJ51270.1 hypothetical protein CTM_13768 [Clostridium tetanomorphum DSM 665]MBC2397857.1 hypothetical protein [Clostridium tetanomorphum]MBP1864830.1 putative membrane protein YvbJ [Clostridium tetanomorphum]NRS84006.1 putative membrane protein YvbJ [Clostridium tetanomorphum]NRZ97223.1 putative membrane protein YvbJ [Clostridium tetanomorphum]